MNAQEFLGLERTADPYRWKLPVSAGIATSEQFMFGGCGLAAAIETMGQSLGLPVVWATGQYVSFASVGETLDLEVTTAAAGHYTTQASVRVRVGDREIIDVIGALGERPSPFQGSWGTAPTYPDPETCPRRVLRPAVEAERSILDRLEIRLAKGVQWSVMDGVQSADGRCGLWIRMPDIEMSPAALAVLGDYVPYGIGQALGQVVRANSLDNTLRIASPKSTEWVLVDIMIHSVGGGVGHGEAHLWSQDGTLLAIASQSAMVREFRTPPVEESVESGVVPDSEVDDAAGHPSDAVGPPAGE